MSGWNDIRLARAGMEGEEDRPIYLEGNNPTYPKGEGSLVIRNIEEKKYPLMKFELSWFMQTLKIIAMIVRWGDLEEGQDEGVGEEEHFEQKLGQRLARAGKEGDLLLIWKAHSLLFYL